MHMFEVLYKYYIKDCQGYFVIDNATANDCIVTSILDQLFENDGINYNPHHHRFKCNSHTINLSV